MPMPKVQSLLPAGISCSAQQAIGRANRLWQRVSGLRRAGGLFGARVRGAATRCEGRRDRRTFPVSGIRAEPMTAAAQADDARVPLVIGAIGHRDLVPNEIPGLSERIRNFLDSLQGKYPDLRVAVLTSLADGADRLVADVASSLGMPVDVCAADAERSLRARLRYRLAARIPADPLRQQRSDLAARQWQHPEDVTHPGAARDLQYAQLGAFIAAHCHILLALWDGNEDGPSGGTAAIIRFHQDDFMLGLTPGEPRSRLDDTDDESDLVYHIVCSRDRPNGSPLAPLEVGQSWWLSRADRTPQNPRHAETLRNRAAIEWSNSAATRCVIGPRSSVRGMRCLPTGTGIELGAGARTIADLFGVADWLARHYQRLTLSALQIVCAFALIASLCFIGYGDLSGQEQMIYPYLVVHGGEHRHLSRCATRRMATSLSRLPRTCRSTSRSVLLGGVARGASCAEPLRPRRVSEAPRPRAWLDSQHPSSIGSAAKMQRRMRPVISESKRPFWIGSRTRIGVSCTTTGTAGRSCCASIDSPKRSVVSLWPGASCWLRGSLVVSFSSIVNRPMN